MGEWVSAVFVLSSVEDDVEKGEEKGGGIGGVFDMESVRRLRFDSCWMSVRFGES